MTTLWALILFATLAARVPALIARTSCSNGINGPRLAQSHSAGITRLASSTTTGAPPLQPLDLSAEDTDEALIRRISAEVMAESGVELDQLINPSKVVNLERDLVALAKELENPGMLAEERARIEEKMEKNRAKLSVEKRGVMRGWLKGLFVGQSVLAVVISFAMVYDLFPGMELQLPIRVLGFWMWWLFIVPSLRARKPGAKEKDALNIAFLATPAVSLIMPVVTKDVAIIWWANAAVTAACYGYAYTKSTEVGGEGETADSTDGEQQSSLPPIIVRAIKALDYGSGKERGERN